MMLIQRLKPSSLSIEKITVDYLNEHCSNALWMTQRKTPMWRGDFTLDNAITQNGGMSVVDTLKTTRKSANTKNYYTVLFDYIFSNSMPQFPLRSKSIICNTEKVSAYRYGSVMAVIPTDNAKIGFVNSNDIWNAKLPKIGNMIANDTLIGLNHLLEECGIVDDLESIKKWFDDAEHDDMELHKMFSNFDKLIDYYKQIINDNFGTCTSANIPMTRNHELWISGDVVLIDDNFWREHIKRGTDVTKWELK